MLENGAHARAHAQVVVGEQVGQRDADGPRGIGKATAVEEHYAVVRRETEYGIDGLVLGGEPVGELPSVAAPSPAHEVDLRVVPGAQRIGRQFESHTGIEVGEAPIDNRARAHFVRLLCVDEREHGEERHLHLLWERQASGVIQRDLPTIRNHPVDERDVSRVGADRFVSTIELFELRG